MSFKYGALSRANYAELHPKLQRILDVALQSWDHTITDGGRTLEEQRKNVARGVSQTLASKHLIGADGKSHAMDVMPYPIDWPAIQRGIDAVKQVDGGMQVLEAYMFQGFLAGIAAAQGTKIRQGVDWDSDREFSDHTFLDLPHTELAE